MGGEKEFEVEKPKKEGKTKIGNFRIHQSNGEVHFHDDESKLKVAVPVATWYKVWNILKIKTGTEYLPDPVNKTGLIVKTELASGVFDVSIDIQPAVFSSNYEKIDTFTKGK